VYCNPGCLADLESFQLLPSFVSGENDAVSISSSQHTPSRCASAKKKTPTMEILPDKKELIMKGGTFQEQLSAFQ